MFLFVLFFVMDVEVKDGTKAWLYTPPSIMCLYDVHFTLLCDCLCVSDMAVLYASIIYLYML